jgi:hypothetical protein
VARFRLFFVLPGPRAVFAAGVMHSWRALSAAVLFLVCAGVVPKLCAQGYGGPSLLSRGGNQPGIRGRAPIDFNVYASARGMYETGLLQPELDETGQLRSDAVYGTLIEGGVYGGKDWKRHSLGLDYRADYRYQPAIPAFNGTNQAMSVLTQHRISRRLMLITQHMGGTTNRAFGGFAGPTFGGIDRIGVPLNELFDVRIYYAQSAAGFSYQKSARKPFQLGRTVSF